MTNVLLNLTIAMLVLEVVFGRFEERTSRIKRLLKLVIVLGGAATLARYVNPMAGYLFFGAAAIIGGTFHFWWCSKNTINPWTAEPADRYYKLRGWPVPKGFKVATAHQDD